MKGRGSLPQALGACGHLSRLGTGFSKDPDGRDDGHEFAIAGLVQNPANLIDLLADFDSEGTGGLLRREDLGALVNFKGAVIEQDIERVEEGTADLVAIFG